MFTFSVNAINLSHKIIRHLEDILLGKIPQSADIFTKKHRRSETSSHDISVSVVKDNLDPYFWKD